MEKVILEQTIRARLVACTQVVELCDEPGATIGRFVPEELFRSSAYAWARASISDEELDRRAAEPGGSSLAEILQRLEKP